MIRLLLLLLGREGLSDGEVKIDNKELRREERDMGHHIILSMQSSNMLVPLSTAIFLRSVSFCRVMDPIYMPITSFLS